MLNKKYFWAPILIFTLIISAMLISVPAKAADVPDDVVIENTYLKAKIYEACKLSHKKHSEEYVDPLGKKIACKDCHHVYEDGKNVWEVGKPVAKCMTCHNGNQNLSPSKTKKMAKEEKVKEIAWAYHENCYMCHKAVKKVNKKSKAWTSCVKCHPKKK